MRTLVQTPRTYMKMDAAPCVCNPCTPTARGGHLRTVGASRQIAWLLQWQEVKTDSQVVLRLLHLLYDTWIPHTHSYTDRHGFRESSLEKNLFRFLVFTHQEHSKGYHPPFMTTVLFLLGIIQTG